MSDIPSSWDEVGLGHHITHYTFLPVLALLFGSILATPVLWFINVLTFSEAILLPWAVFAFAVGYIALFGDYVMPAETYRKYRSGEWGNE